MNYHHNPEDSMSLFARTPLITPQTSHWERLAKAESASELFQALLNQETASLNLIDKETCQMSEQAKENNETIVPTTKSVIAVVFTNNNKTFHYWAERGVCKVGDYVVCKSPKGFSCAKVVQVGGFTRREISLASRWIVQVIDSKAYDLKVLKERAMQDIKARLRQRKEEMEEIAIFKLLASSDPVTAALLDNLNKMEAGEITTEMLELDQATLFNDDDDDNLL